ncbi:non-ribosomal peptide synthetase [Chelativorans salis]|uniref:Non-ribosomal peptide synthetase n=1 Tax=Chelativorans salis TaxID=2978478 RepID=A0ABT2LNC3_9HYPH|nr:non-ribosomal peptide synthetase [Chelativorans sp. EGI FJ00035]MCT7375569.1 non-ribosomal peptide synthetase [Chelativorans sp. EGI FJ00035]
MNSNEGRAEYLNGRVTAARPNFQARNSYDSQRSIHSLVSEQAALRPYAIAVQFGSTGLTYTELDRLSSALAGELMRLGVTKGDVIGLFLPRALNTIVAKLAILKAGAAYAPFDPSYPANHLGYMIGDCNPKLILVDKESIGAIRAIPTVSAVTDLGYLLESAEKGLPHDLPDVSGGDAAYVMYTSGSTGRPKGVVIPHRGIARLVRDQNYIRFEPDDVVLHTATISFDAATFEIWGALLNGSTLLGIGDRKLSLPRVAQTIDDNRVTVMLLTTGLFHLLVDHRSSRLASLRHVLFGGEVASSDHAKRFLRGNPDCILTNAYGPTEVTVMASAYTIPPDFEGDEIPIGCSIAHSRVHILDEDLRELPPGSEGQLAVSGDGLAIGYLNRPDLTRERFVTIHTAEGNSLRCYLTGDLAMMDSDGILHFRGRLDRQIKIDGKRIELDEIEAALRRDARLADAVADCHKNSAGTKQIVAYLRPHPPMTMSEADFTAAILSTLKTVLPSHMIPSRAMVLDRFPMNQAGKIDRSQLPPPPPEAAVPTAPLPAGGDTEVLLTRLWEQVLGRTGVGLDQNFFDLGGTSMQLIRVHAALEESLGRSIDVVAVFQHPNIRSLARHLDSGNPSAAPATSVHARADLRKRMMSQFRRSTS